MSQVVEVYVATVAGLVPDRNMFFTQHLMKPGYASSSSPAMAILD